MVTLRSHSVFIFILLSFFVISLSSARLESLTFDEIVHIEDTKRIYETGNLRTSDPYNPPFANEIIGLPILLRLEESMPGYFPSDRAMPYRMMVIGVSILLLVSVYLVVLVRFGKLAASVSSLTLAFDPLLLSLGHYIKFDIITALLFFWAYMSVVYVFEDQTLRNYVLLGISWGFALASRILAIPLLFLSFGALCLAKPSRCVRVVKHNIRRLLLSFVILSCILWATFLFQSDVIIAPREDETRVSAVLRSRASAQNNRLMLFALDVLEKQPVPLGRYLALVKNTALRRGHTENVVFLGSVRSMKSWYFYVVHWFLKTPPVVLVFLAASAFLACKNRAYRRAIGVFTIPVGVVIAFLSFSDTIPLVRYGFAAHPFLAVLVGGSMRYRKEKQAKIFSVILGAVLGISVLSSFPHFLSYVNVFAGVGNEKYLLFSDSNVDWGQGLITLRSYVDLQKPRTILLSYFGRDDAAAYGFDSDVPYGSYKTDEICAFHPVRNTFGDSSPMTIISITNWHTCGYSVMEDFSKDRIADIVGRSFIVFTP